MKSFSTYKIAIKIAIFPLILTAILFVLKINILAYITLILSIFIFYFFRDPVRKAPNIPNAILCPADGKILSVEKIKHPEFSDNDCYRIKIFLSIFNVHIQRSPIQGNISVIQYSPGKFLNALNDKASDDNENNLIGIENGKIKIFVKQIAGVIARRIICYCKIGDWVDKGEKYGLICFGSRVEAYLPGNVEIRVKQGMNVHAGTSILGIYQGE